MDELLDSQSISRDYEIASKGKRFTNYIIDVIGYYILSLLVGGVIGGILIMEGNEDILLSEEASIGVTLMEYLIGLIVVLVYYTMSEYFMKGKTIGKFITRTRTVTINNERMDFGTTLKRSLCRVVPFEPFSFLGDKPTGWHDTWTDTKVIVDENWEEY